MKTDKPRDIARSVLPSTRRKSARDDKRAYHSKHRAAQRQVNHRIERSLAVIDDEGHLSHDPDLFDDFEERTVYDGYSASTKDDGLSWDDMNAIVDMRRNGDKLGPLLSWAKATHDRLMTGPEWTTPDKIAYFKAVLPDTLQGRHALGHVKTDLGLFENPFYYGFFPRREYHVTTKDEFRTALNRLLSTSKGRMEFHENRLDIIPSAAHNAESNNHYRSTAHAVDEDGNPRYINVPGFGRRAVMVGVYIPQIVKVTCEVCTFLRNDPLSTPESVTRFVDEVWDGIKRARWRFLNDNTFDGKHNYIIELRDYVLYGVRRV